MSTDELELHIRKHFETGTAGNNRKQQQQQ